MKSSNNRFSGLVVLTFIAAILFAFGCEHFESETVVEPDPGEGWNSFNYIQTEIFDVSCATSGCHLGASAPHGLNLAEGQSYDLLINVASVLDNTRDRVTPGDPDNSMVVRLVEGLSTPQMPFFADPISEALQDSLRQWVADGALQE